MADSRFFFDDFTLDTERRELHRGSERVALGGPQVFDLLLHLVLNRDKVVSKDDMLESVWKGRIVSESTLTGYINAVRKALGDSGEAQRLVRTVPRKGIRFVGDVRAETAVAANAVSPSAASIRPAVAVLPFTNMGGDIDQDYFADGITEDIITALSKWRSFPVIARNSSFTYKGRSVDVRQVGRELGVRYVLEGSVRKAGNRVRVTAQLIDAADGAHLWAERYDRELVDVFAIQDEISQRIAAVVEPELGRHEQRLSSAKPVANLEAWDCLHRGLHLLYKFTRADIAASRPLFERALDLDPQLSRAHTSLAYTHQLDLLHGYVADRAASIALLLHHARRGVQLDDDDSYAHLMLAFAYSRAGQPDLAVATGRKAVEVNPSDAWALGALGDALDLAGRPREALACLERTLTLTPRDPHMKFYLSVGARICRHDRDHGAAESWARKSVELDPSHARGHLVKAIALGHFGRAKEARAAFDACEALQPGYAAQWIAAPQYGDAADNAHLVDGLRKAGINSRQPPE